MTGVAADVDPAVVRHLAHRVLMASFQGVEVPDWLLDRLAQGLGSVCLFGSNLTGDDAQARRLVGRLRAASPGGCLVATDEEGGDVTRLDFRTGSRVPGAAALGAVDDLRLTRGVAAGVGRRLRSVGVDLDLAPVADVNSEPDNPVIGVRSFGADPQLVARNVTAYVEGLQGAGVAACVKHFPGHGATTEDSHVAAPLLDVPLEVLRDRELVPFAAAVRGGAAAVMTSHVLVSALDPDRPATTSRAVLDLLRTELGFDGLLVSDALDMAGVRVPYGGEPNAAVHALAAGCDLLCLCADGDEAFLAGVIDEVVAAVLDGRLPLARITEAAARVDALVGRLATGHRSDSGADDGGPGTEAIEAARAALRLEGELPDLRGALVLEFEVAPGVAQGAVPWGIGQHLAELLAGVEQRSVHAADAAALPASVPDRPLVAVVRDAHRHRWVADALGALVAARPDTLVVETGWPGRGPLPGRTRLWTYGAALVTRLAAAELLAGGPAVAEPTRGAAGAREEGGT